MFRLAFAAGIFIVTVFAGVLVVRAGPEHDVNQDGTVDLTDALDVLAHFGEEPPTPTPMITRTYSVSQSRGAGPSGPLIAYCDPGDSIAGGGVGDGRAFSGVAIGLSAPYLSSPETGQGWIGSWNYGANYPITVYAVCTDNPPAHVADACTTDPSASGAIRWVAGNNHCYRRFTATLTWLEAKADCESSGGYLATITSAAENDFVWASVGVPGAFIGFSDAAQEGVWTWVTGEVSAYANWHAGEPNNGMGGPVEDAAAFHGAYSDGTWNDITMGTSNPADYVCEIE